MTSKTAADMDWDLIDSKQTCCGSKMYVVNHVPYPRQGEARRVYRCRRCCGGRVILVDTRRGIYKIIMA